MRCRSAPIPPTRRTCASASGSWSASRSSSSRPASRGGCLYWLVGETAVALTPWGYVAGSVISLVVFARTRNFAFLRTAQLLLILIAPALGMIMIGGLEESSSVDPVVAPRAARSGRLRPPGARVAVVRRVRGHDRALARSRRGRSAGGRRPPERFVRTFDVLNIVAVSFVAMLLLVTFARGRDAAQERVEALLLNVLPRRSRERLQEDPSTIADHFDDASILFADVVDFTPLSSRLDAREVVGLLDRLFTSFDELVDRYDVEKIKTIGDCYMVAAGVPRQRPDHAHALASSRSRCATAPTRASSTRILSCASASAPARSSRASSGGGGSSTTSGATR